MVFLDVCNRHVGFNPESGRPEKDRFIFAGCGRAPTPISAGATAMVTTATPDADSDLVGCLIGSRCCS